MEFHRPRIQCLSRFQRPVKSIWFTHSEFVQDGDRHTPLAQLLNSHIALYDTTRRHEPPTKPLVIDRVFDIRKHFCLSDCHFVCPSVRLSVSLSLWLSVSLSDCLSVCCHENVTRNTPQETPPTGARWLIKRMEGERTQRQQIHLGVQQQQQQQQQPHWQQQQQH